MPPHLAQNIAHIAQNAIFCQTVSVGAGAGKGVLKILQSSIGALDTIVNQGEVAQMTAFARAVTSLPCQLCRLLQRIDGRFKIVILEGEAYLPQQLNLIGHKSPLRGAALAHGDGQ